MVVANVFEAVVCAILIVGTVGVGFHFVHRIRHSDEEELDNRRHL